MEKQFCKVCGNEYPLDDMYKFGDEYFCDEDCARSRAEEIFDKWAVGDVISDSEYITLKEIISEF